MIAAGFSVCHFFYQIGVVLLELGRPEEARKSFEAALNSEPDHSVRPTKINF